MSLGAVFRCVFHGAGRVFLCRLCTMIYVKCIFLWAESAVCWIKNETERKCQTRPSPKLILLSISGLNPPAPWVMCVQVLEFSFSLLILWRWGGKKYANRPKELMEPRGTKTEICKYQTWGHFAQPKTLILFPCWNISSLKNKAESHFNKSAFFFFFRSRWDEGCLAASV